MKELTALQIRAAIAAAIAKGLSPRTAGGVHAVISGPCHFAYDAGAIDTNPITKVHAPKFRGTKVRPPEPVVMDALLHQAEEEGHPLYEFLLVLAYGGVRRSEAMALEWDDLNIATRTIKINKAAVKARGQGVVIHPPKSENSYRAVILPVFVVEALVLRREALAAAGVKSKLMFSRSNGDYLRPTTIDRHLKELGSRAGFPKATFHVLRHYHAPEALDVAPLGSAPRGGSGTPA